MVGQHVLISLLLFIHHSIQLEPKFVEIGKYKYSVHLPPAFKALSFHEALTKCRAENSTLAQIHDPYLFDLSTSLSEENSAVNGVHKHIYVYRRSRRIQKTSGDDKSKNDSGLNRARFLHNHRRSNEKCLLLNLANNRLKISKCRGILAGYACRSAIKKNQTPKNMLIVRSILPQEVSTKLHAQSPKFKTLIINKVTPNFEEQAAQMTPTANDTTTATAKKATTVLIAVGGPSILLAFFGLMLYCFLRFNRSKSEKPTREKLKKIRADNARKPSGIRTAQAGTHQQYPEEIMEEYPEIPDSPHQYSPALRSADPMAQSSVTTIKTNKDEEEVYYYSEGEIVYSDEEIYYPNVSEFDDDIQTEVSSDTRAATSPERRRPHDKFSAAYDTFHSAKTEQGQGQGRYRSQK